MNVYQKIAEVMQKVGYIQKDGFVETGKGKGYKAVTDEKVVTSIRPALIEAGLIILPIDRVVRRTDEVVKGYDGSERINRITEIDVTYRIINVEEPTDFVDVVSSGSGVDTQDKGVGKAMTYARKYMYLNAFQIPTGEDPDAISSDNYSANLYGDQSQKFDRELCKKYVVTMAKNRGLSDTINDDGYKGKSWDEVTDDQLKELKVFLSKS